MRLGEMGTGLFQRILGLPDFGQIPGYFGEANDLTGPIDQWMNDDVCPETRSILTNMPIF
ncbi:MAG TPA: hypothetical protein VHX39_27590 [Acetobacteraceae bacterium]|nr:hypothetical protein [Acetobacteraceae bacterium]